MADYNLKSLKLPRLTGWKLRLFAAALAKPVLRPLLMRHLFQKAGLLQFRQWILEEPPTYYPVYISENMPADSSVNTQVPNPEQTRNAPSAKVPFSLIRNYTDAYRSGEKTPEQVAEKILDAVAAKRRGASPLNLFIACDPEDVRRQARQSARRILAGKALSALDGVPVAIKDEVDQVPYPTTGGTTFLGRKPARYDATVVARLRDAGALLIGKTNMHEIGINPNGLNEHYGTVINPYGPTHESGGSSSGSSAAVAAGLCPVAIGADGGGSIRIPAALCGVVGLKPTFGRISEYGALPLCWSMAHLGPIGISTEDVVRTYAIIAGPDPKDPNSGVQPETAFDNWNSADLNGLTLGIYPQWFEHAAPPVTAACTAMLERLQDCGARTREIEIPELEQMRIAHGVIILSEIAANMSRFQRNRHDFGFSVRVNLELGRAFTSPDYVHALRMRTRAINIFTEIFQKVDIILTPTTAITAPSIPPGGLQYGWSDLSTVTELMRFVFPGNLTGLPTISFPVGYDAGDLPIGMQAIGRPWEEHRLLRIAYTAEQVVERKKPQIFFEILD
jgi:Asp-tRNA(Asn)/Glu-tRNA(Gln) amidotransferase A subunit family amidase